MLHFYVYRAPKRPKPRKVQYPAIFLFDDNWNDYGYETLFKSRIQLDAHSEEIELGEVKILEISDEGLIYSPGSTTISPV